MTSMSGSSDWRVTVSLDDLQRDGRRVVRMGSRQIALFWHREQVFACNHRCPHEGYPLSQGILNDECTLTCQWHNWKFDLRDGSNVYGGDALRVYPTKLLSEADGPPTVWVDVAEEDPESRRVQALQRLSEALDDDDASRIAREVVRYQVAGGSLLDVVRWVVQSRAARLEYGATHAFGALIDWLTLGDMWKEPHEKLVCVVEPLAHVARDTLRTPEFPFTEDVVSGTGTELLQAFAQGIEDEDERRAVAALRGALRRDVSLSELELAFSRSALSHYADFGHSLIYTQKLFRSIDVLGSAVAEPLLSSLARSLVYATREEQIPEFRGYNDALAAFGNGRSDVPDPLAFDKLGIDAALKLVVDHSGAESEALYDCLFRALCRRLYHFDVKVMHRTDNAVADNVGWLDLTHGITFASAVRVQAQKFPELWPAGLLQMALFVGRNVKYQDFSLAEPTPPTDVPGYFEKRFAVLLDHGQPEPIMSAHLVKVLFAAHEEWTEGHDCPELVPGVERFFTTPPKRHHALRNARQAIHFVGNE